MRWWLALAAAVLIAIGLATRWRHELIPIPIAYLALYAAMVVPVRSFDRRDRPIVRTVLVRDAGHQARSAVRIEPLRRTRSYLLSVMAGGLAVAALSWFLIERPALSLRSITPFLRLDRAPPAERSSRV